MRLLPRSFRGQLILLFLLLTLLPAILLTVLVTNRLLDAVERWEQPGVAQALTGSFEVARDLITRMENDLLQRGQLLGADAALDPPRDEDAVRGLLAAAYNLDFAQVYDASGALLFEVTRDPLIAPPGPLEEVGRTAASADPVFRDEERSILARAVYRGDPEGPTQVLVVGNYLDRDFYPRLQSLTLALDYYGRLRTLIAINQRVTLLSVGLIVLVLSGTAVWVARRLAARLSRPVEALGRGMEAMTQGAGPVRVEPAGGDEFERLIATFNVMSLELARSREMLAQGERQAAWREVARRVAHEMRNALTPMTFSLHRVRKASSPLPEAEAGRLREALDTVLEEVEGLKRLAASFSELARLPVPEMKPVDLAEVLRAAAAGTDEEAVAVRLEAPERPVTVHGDAALLRQAFTNLVRNAVEAMEGKGHLWIRLEAADGTAVVTVEDDGPGWPDTDREALLEPYVTTKHEGTGLGLSLVRRTFLQHGGTVKLDDRPEGGARVTLYLPAGGGPVPGAGGEEDA